jgi:hypothetical protein
MQLIQPPARECGKNVLFAINEPNLAARFASYALSLTAQGSVRKGSIGKVMTESDLSYACARRLAHRENGRPNTVHSGVDMISDDEDGNINERHKVRMQRKKRVVDECMSAAQRDAGLMCAEHV